MTSVRPESRFAIGAFAALVMLASCAARAARVPDSSAPRATLAVSPRNWTAAQRKAVNDSVQAVITRAVADGAFPGAYAVVGTSTVVLAEYGAGKLDAADPTKPNSRTVWDMASMSKLMATTSAMVQLVGSQRVALDSPVVYYLPSWTASGAARITVRQLLSHNSGLPAGRPLYKETDTDTAARTLVYATSPITPPGSKYVYSDLGFILLGRLVQQVTATPLDQYVEKNVFGPLGMTDTRYLPPADWLSRIAPTEIDPWRGRHVRGEVHDENAVRLGGVAGHAGVFSSGRDVARFAQMYLSGGTLAGTRILPAATLKQFIAVQDTTISRRALGWETPTGGNSAGRRLSAISFGHTGFTGTSLWMDPTRDLFVALLSNRVNPTRQNGKISAVRVALADAVVAALEAAAPRAPAR
ncbi:MAG: beta-lactamase family protein [Phycisphaerae bacterium]|nr:beta-lactamase family protein [Gemmatimonadaceae bacterium]